MTLTTPELLQRLKRHYIKPGDFTGGIFLPEVGWNPAGGESGRAGTCDAIYVGFTNSSGRLLVGHELKVSRADWLAELSKPGKSDPWADQCHEWWLVVSDPAIVKDGELPAGWGLMVPGRSKTRMQIVTPALRREDRTPSWLAVRSIMARQDTLCSQSIHEIKAKAYSDAMKDMDKRVEERVNARMFDKPDSEELKKRLDLIEEALGRRVYTGDNHTPFSMIGLDELREMGEVAKKLGSVRHLAKMLTDGYNNPVGRTREALNKLDHALTDLRNAGKELEAEAEGLF